MLRDCIRDGASEAEQLPTMQDIPKTDQLRVNIGSSRLGVNVAKLPFKSATL